MNQQEKISNYEIDLSEINSLMMNTSSDVIKLVNVLKQKDILTFNHSVQVSKLINEYCRRYQINPSMQLEYVYGALIHDFGKIFIPKDILYKSSKLTFIERKKINKHSVDGYNFLKKVGVSSNIYIYALYHHLQFDCKNYSTIIDDYEITIDKKECLANLSSEQIMGIDLLKVCDSYDAMTTQRCYNKPKTKQEAINELVKNSKPVKDDNGNKQQQFNGIIVSNFIKIL